MERERERRLCCWADSCVDDVDRSSCDFFSVYTYVSRDKGEESLSRATEAIAHDRVRGPDP